MSATDQNTNNSSKSNNLTEYQTASPINGTSGRVYNSTSNPNSTFGGFLQQYVDYNYLSQLKNELQQLNPLLAQELQGTFFQNTSQNGYDHPSLPPSFSPQNGNPAFDYSNHHENDTTSSKNNTDSQTQTKALEEDPYATLLKTSTNSAARRNSLPFSYVNLQPSSTSQSHSASNAPTLQVVSGSFTSSPGVQIPVGSRLRHRCSLERDVHFGVSTSQGKRETMEDEYMAVPYRRLSQSLLQIPPNLQLPKTHSTPSKLTQSQSASVIECVKSTDESEDKLPKKRKIEEIKILEPGDSITITAASVEQIQPLPKEPIVAIETSDTLAQENKGIVPPKSDNNEVSPAKNTAGKPTYAFFAVYDGHGGTACAEYVRMNLHSNIASQESFQTGTNVEEAILNGFLKTEREYSQEGGDPGSGTTACVVIIYDNILYIANVGDSAAVMCRNGKALELTVPHSLKVESERERVAKEGGRIYEGRLAHPFWNPKMINIGITRALGDLYFKSEQFTNGKPSGLICNPDIREYELTSDDKFIILATDGFWDQVSSQEAVNFVLHEKETNAKLICKRMTDLVKARSKLQKCWEDNATVLLVKLKGNELKESESTANQSKSQTQSPQSQSQSQFSSLSSQGKANGNSHEKLSADAQLNDYKFQLIPATPPNNQLLL